MSRLFMTGWEAGDTTSGNNGAAEGGGGFWNFGNTGAVQTTSARINGWCASASTTSALAHGQRFLVFAGATSRDYFLRILFQKSANPSNAIIIGSILTGAAGRILSVRVNTDGTLSLIAADGTTVLGTSASALSDGVYQRVEARCNVGTTTTGQTELRVDGNTVITAVTNANLGTTAPGGFEVGSVLASSNMGGVTFLYDDVAINDSVGTVQNTWPGDGHIVHLVPTADSFVGTGWTLGTGTATGGNAHLAVDNLPPVGVADLAAGSDTKQIRDANNTAASYQAAMTTYTAAGMAAADTLECIQAVCITGAPSATSPKAGSQQVASNPADAGLFSFGNFYSGVVAGTYPTGWAIRMGAITDRSNANLAALTSANYGTAPVQIVNQVTASTRIAMVCAMHIRVEYLPGVAATPSFPNQTRTARNFLLRR